MRKPLERAKRLAEQRRKSKRNKRSFRPKGKAERSYVAALRDIVSGMATLVNKCVMPLVRKQYPADDNDRVEPFVSSVDSRITDCQSSYEYYGSKASEKVEEKAAAMPGVDIEPPAPSFPSVAANDENPFSQQVRRTCKKSILDAVDESTEAVRNQINSAVGVDMKAMMTTEKIHDYTEASIAENVSLIKTIPSQFFTDIRRVILDGYRSGKSLTQISADVQHIYGVHDFTASRIARDQMCKISSDIMIRRMKDAGIERFRWSTSNDERVTGNPAGKYPRAKVKCYDIARRDIGYGPGVYLISDGATVNGEKNVYPGRAHIMDRCVAVALIAGVDYFPWDE